MTTGPIDITWHGHHLRLLPDRAIYLPAERTLLVADVHLGKPASFRSAGVPVPEAITDRDLARMTALIGSIAAERLLILGDLIHDAAALRDRTREAVARWRVSLPNIAIDLVVGNHDRKADSCEPLGVRVLGEVVTLNSGLRLTHEPPEADAPPTLCGHLHPVISVGPRRSAARVRAACFHFEANTGVLPAFGTFTGGRAMHNGPACAVFAAGDQTVVPVTSEARQITHQTHAPTTDSHAESRL